MNSEVNLIATIVIMGVFILALVTTLIRCVAIIIRLSKTVHRNNERINAVDDYFLNKFLVNKLDDERKKETGRTGESS